LASQQAPDGTWVLARHISPKTQLPFMDAIGDTSKFICAILAKLDKYEGKTFCVATTLYSWEKVATIMLKATSKTIVYKQISIEKFKKSLSFAIDVYVEGFSYQEKFGFYDPDSKKLIAWAAKNAQGRLSTLKEYFERHSLELAWMDTLESREAGKQEILWSLDLIVLDVLAWVASEASKIHILKSREILYPHLIDHVPMLLAIDLRKIVLDLELLIVITTSSPHSFLRAK